MKKSEADANVKEVLLKTILSVLPESKHSKYKKWLVTLPDLSVTIKPHLSWYEKNINTKVTKNLRDVFKFKTTEEFIRVIKEIEEPSINDLKSAVFKVLDNDNFLVIIPLSFESSKLYGAGTKWCTTQKQYFDSHSNGGVLFYIMDKKLNVKLATHIKHGTTIKSVEENKITFFLSDDESLSHKKLVTIYGLDYYKPVLDAIKTHYSNIYKEINRSKFISDTHRKLMTIKKDMDKYSLTEFESLFSEAFKVIDGEFQKINPEPYNEQRLTDDEYDFINTILSDGNGRFGGDIYQDLPF
jgi:hypothetical protein